MIRTTHHKLVIDPESVNELYALDTDRNYHRQLLAQCMDKANGPWVKTTQDFLDKHVAQSS
jgi:hypothetical protein